jgi:hypothetical protein
MAKLKSTGFAPDYDAPILDEILVELKKITAALEAAPKPAESEKPATRAQRRETR